jgi:ribonuclease BN (tRNA processing enzyme)
MKVTVLGSGTAVPIPGRFPAGYLVEHDDMRVAVDLGPGTLRRLGEAGVDLGALDAVCLTHYHTDHCADVAALLFGLRNPRYAGRPPLEIVGATGLARFLDNLRATWPWCRPEGYELRVTELAPGSFRLGPFEVAAAAIEHTALSLGYRFRAPDGTVAAFSGDATFCDGLIETARGADLFVCDAAFPTAAPGPGHMTPTEAGRAARLAGARTLCLTHFYPECDGHDLATEARAEFQGRIVLARDLMVFDLS